MKKVIHAKHLIEDTEKLRCEKTIPLAELAQILIPRKQLGTRGLSLKAKDFKYPLDSDKLADDVTTDILLQTGDILLSQGSQGNQKFYLIHKMIERTVHPSPFLIVIRPNTQKIISEYLFFYLQSKTIKKYICDHLTGAQLLRLSINNLRTLPIMLPELITQQKSKSIFLAKYLTSPTTAVKRLSSEIYSTRFPSKPIQRELVEELLADISVTKQIVLEQLILQDLHELEGCSKNKFYKSFLVLAGSILEAFLLDWLSELEHVDHFASNEEFTLGKLIWKKLKKALPSGNLSEKVLKNAGIIKDSRNMVHAKVFFQSNAIDHELCEVVLNALKFVLKSRKLHNDHARNLH